MKILANVLLYEAVWTLCVFWPTWGVLVSVILIVAHLYFSFCRKQDLAMMIALLAAGVVIDGILHVFSFMQFTVTGFPIPIWLAVIWMGLAMLPHHSLSWMKGRPVLSCLFGAFGGPFAYWAGTRAGAAEFTYHIFPSLFLLAVIWAVLWPLVMWYGAYIFPVHDK